MGFKLKGFKSMAFNPRGYKRICFKQRRLDRIVLKKEDIKEFVLNYIYFAGYSSVPVVQCVKSPTPTQGKCFLGNYVKCL